MLRVAKIELKTADLLKALAPYLGEELPKDAKVYHVHFSPGLAEIKLLVESETYPEILGGDTFHYAKPVEFDAKVKVRRRDTDFGDSGTTQEQETNDQGESSEGESKASGGVVPADPSFLVGEPGPEVVLSLSPKAKGKK